MRPVEDVSPGILVPVRITRLFLMVMCIRFIVVLATFQVQGGIVLTSCRIVTLRLLLCTIVNLLQLKNNGIVGISTSA